MRSVKVPPGLALAIALSLGFLILSYARLAGDTMSTAFGNVVHESVFAGSVWGTALARNLVIFALILVVLHLCLGVACWALARLAAFAFPRFAATPSQWVLAWCCLCFVTILIANAAIYPNSSLGLPYRDAVRASFARIDLFGATTVLTAVAILGTLTTAAVRWIRAGRPVPKPAVIGALAVVAISTAAALPSSSAPVAPSARPHVIIIGVDSLRYDETQPGGPSEAAHVGAFLRESVSFSDATTPLARTFPSWVSILTGRNPHTTGAIINLLPRRKMHPGETLGDLFKRAGYRTVYGIDEVRFSNIDASYGFDQTVTPPIGASDFLIGWFGDTPVSNLLVNTRLGGALFPYLHANRGAAKLYDPDAYLERLDREVSFGQPTFLALHLTLAHWPFHWKDRLTVRGTVPSRKSAITRVDQQFADVIALLERKGALANALVVVLSDHGESLGSNGDSLVHADQGLPELFRLHKEPNGHGTDVLSPQQYQVVLGMRCFGTCPFSAQTPRSVAAPVSLEDLAPTLVDLFSLQSSQRFDGRSLLAFLNDKPGAGDTWRDRIRFTESEFNPTGVMQASGKISTQAAAAAALFYTVDPDTDRIEIRSERLPELLEQRQYAAFDAQTVLALLPDADTRYRLFAVRRDRSEARQLTSIPSPTAYPDLQALYQELAWRYGLKSDRAAPVDDAK